MKYTITPTVNTSFLSPELLDDNVADDFACAKKIYARHGFKAWYGWQAKCQLAHAVTAC